MPEVLKPPPTIACSRVLEYAILNDSVRYSGRSNLFSGDTEVGPVPCLAICQSLTRSELFLFHCDHDWSVLGTEARASVNAAKAAADEIYAGVSGLWIDAHVTEDEAAKHIDEMLGRCSFCNRSPLDFEGNPRFIQKNDTWICESCVRDCFELLRLDDQGA